MNKRTDLTHARARRLQEAKQAEMRDQLIRDHAARGIAQIEQYLKEVAR